MIEPADRALLVQMLDQAKSRQSTRDGVLELVDHEKTKVERFLRHGPQNEAPTGVSLSISVDRLYKPGICRVRVFPGWPIEIMDTGRRTNCKLPLSEAKSRV